MSEQKITTHYSQHTEISSAFQKWLSHQWKKTDDADVDPFDETTFPCIMPESELILKSNYYLISVNC